MTLQEAVEIFNNCNANPDECRDGCPLYAAAKAEDVGEFGQFSFNACNLLVSLRRLLEGK